MQRNMSNIVTYAAYSLVSTILIVVQKLVGQVFKMYVVKKKRNTTSERIAEVDLTFTIDV
jgi:hypothetical protein